MKARIDWNGDTLIVDFSAGRSLAIDLQARGSHPSFFSDSNVRKRPLAVDGFIGDMSQGGSCNAEVIEFSPHSHGTHTECIGHIMREHQSVTSTIDQRPTLVRIMTVDPGLLENGNEIPADVLQGIAEFDGGALAIRTLPNDESKKQRDYSEEPVFPVLSNHAMTMLSRGGLLHLLVDTPSVDQPDSTGLENHALWWGLGREVAAGVPDPARRSITEMIFVPDDIPDGDYWLDLQLAPLVSDAVPSRPMVYPLTRLQA